MTRYVLDAGAVAADLAKRAEGVVSTASLEALSALTAAGRR
jgi:hypothetical protein